MTTIAGLEAEDPRIAFFDQLAPRWDRECSQPEEALRRLSELNGRLGLAPGQDLLEVGCGTGQHTGWLSDTVAPGRVVAVDFSPGMLAEARRRRLLAEFRLLDICSGEPMTDRFDVVVCFNAFPHFRQKRTALRQMARNLKPGGRIFILHLAGSKEINAFHQNLNAPVCDDLLPSADQWPDLLEAAGLRLASHVDQPDLFLLKAILP